MAIIEVKELSKEFKTLNRHEGLKGVIRDLFSRDYRITKAVDTISFSLDEGEVVGFAGPNGAGKSTTIKMLTGVLEPTSGMITVNHLVPFRNRAKNAQNIGVVFGQRTQLWWDLPVIESFNVLKEIYRIKKSDYTETIDSFNRLVNLKELYAKPVRTLSLGQRMLCDIAAAFLHNPKIIFLDEPTIGLDISVKSKIRTLIRELLKPVDYQLFIFSGVAGRMFLNMIIIAIPSLLALIFIFRVSIPVGWNILFFIIAIVLSFLMNFLIDFIVGLISFYTLSVWGLSAAKSIIITILSGAIVPLDFFPVGFRKAVEWLPFRAMFAIPMQMLLSQGEDILFYLKNLGLQLFRILLLGLFSRFFFKHAVRAVTVQGG